MCPLLDVFHKITALDHVIHVIATTEEINLAAFPDAPFQAFDWANIAL